jgi:hypothetical protein
MPIRRARTLRWGLRDAGPIHRPHPEPLAKRACRRVIQKGAPVVRVGTFFETRLRRSSERGPREGLGVAKLRKRAVKILRSFTGVNLCAATFSRIDASRTPHPAGNHPRRSGGTASLASASSASSAPSAVCALEPRRRTDTVFSLASLRPRAMRTGTFARECSRTL